MPYEPVLGSVVVCVECLRGDPGRSPLWPVWAMPVHEDWHAGKAQAEDPPVLEEAS